MTPEASGGTSFLTPLVVQPRAAAELVEATEWYDSQRYGLGLEFVDSVDTVLALIRRHPIVGQEVRSRIRRVLLKRFPFGVFYTIRSDRIDVLAVVHSRRHPARWPRPREG